MNATYIKGCSRCGLDHESVEIVKFERPVCVDGAVRYTHWGSCPTRGEPILIIVRGGPND